MISHDSATVKHEITPQDAFATLVAPLLDCRPGIKQRHPLLTRVAAVPGFNR